MRTINKILVPTDFSDSSLIGLEYALSLAAFGSIQVHLLNVLESDAALVFHSIGRHAETTSRDPEVIATNILRDIIASRSVKERMVIAAVRRGDLVREIVRYAEEENVDLIVMATHGRRGLAHVLIGSVAEKVVRQATVPVLTVKPQYVSETLLNEEDLEEQLHLKI